MYRIQGREAGMFQGLGLRVRPLYPKLRGERSNGKEHGTMLPMHALP